MVKRAVVSPSHHPIVVLPDLAEAEFLVEPALVRGCSRWQSTCCNAWCSFAVSPSIAAVETACDNCTRMEPEVLAKFREISGKIGDGARMAADRQFAFGLFRFDTRTGQLWRDGTEVKLTPRAGAVLHVLVERAGEL